MKVAEIKTIIERIEALENLHKFLCSRSNNFFGIKINVQFMGAETCQINEDKPLKFLADNSDETEILLVIENRIAELKAFIEK